MCDECVIGGNGDGGMISSARTREYLLLYGNYNSGTTPQVKGSATMMVTVVTTQELKAGDVLRRVGPETAQDEPRRGNNDNGCIVMCQVVVGVGEL